LTRFREWWATAESSIFVHKWIKWLSLVAIPPMTWLVLSSEALFRLIMTVVSFLAITYAAWSSQEAAEAKKAAMDATQDNPPTAAE
jgi:hypothetical protein